MEMPSSLQGGVFLRRLNRFAAEVEVDGSAVLVHVANSGRMRELLVPGRRCWLVSRPTGRPSTRKTGYDLALVQVGRILASADARLPNGLVAEAVEHGRLSAFAGFRVVRREVVLGDSRIDLLLSNGDAACYVEAKSVTLVEGGVGLFPDAPTERGRRHLGSLAAAVAQRHRAAVVFVVQRADAAAFAPNDAADPAFGKALRQAIAQGVEVYAYCCRVTRRRVLLAKPLPLMLEPPNIYGVSPRERSERHGSSARQSSDN
ncbi:MAG: DNA/RNA nuclease SfsA [Chloroflexi bacterium]|nr:DNA/RNA nuclease SfsA [Chloroflexota bacterium]